MVLKQVMQKGLLVKYVLMMAHVLHLVCLEHSYAKSDCGTASGTFQLCYKAAVDCQYTHVA